jgi:hypothetical protein
MAHSKLNDADEQFLSVPLYGTILFSGASGTNTWIERDRDVVVRLTVKSVALATTDGATLEVCLELGPDSAKGQDGPAPAETQLRASQSVQILVKAGQRLAFKAYPSATNAQILRTVVWAADIDAAEAQARAANDHPPSAAPRNQGAAAS